MRRVSVPKLNNNDESYALTAWLFEDGGQVKRDEVIAVLETSKATFDLVSETSGILQRLVASHNECKFGDVIGYLFDSEMERQSFLSRSNGKAALNGSALTITKGAQELMFENGISESQLVSLGKKVIKRSDIEALLELESPQRKALCVSRRQISIAETVSLSHQKIPKAFVAMKVYCDEVAKILESFRVKEGLVIGLTEVLVKIIASLHLRFPIFFAKAIEENFYLADDEPGVGVTFDLGKGLFVPVVQKATSKSLREVTETLADFRFKALRDGFKAEDLINGQITISLNPEKDVVLVSPLILPLQTCMLSLSSIQEEVFVKESDTVASRRYVNLGLAYDHRAINGYEAVQFLKAVKIQLESPGPGLSLNSQEDEGKEFKCESAKTR